jgi:N-acetylglucosaminyldiphosphoundecaprenol N-acetyl-beta-D-mannosaminyltransferase
MNDSVRILGVSFSSLNLKQTAELLGQQIDNPTKWPFQLITANPEIVIRAQEDSELRHIMDKADLITADGIGIILASRWRQGRALSERVTGYDLLLELLHKGNERGWSFYFLGADEETSRKAAERVASLYPNVKLAGRHNGFFNTAEEARIVDEIEQIRPDVLIVALGAPAAEKWIHKHKARLTAKLAFGVGGSLDVIAGKVKRAPVFWQKLNLEWFHRLLSQPSRWRRQLLLPVFAFRALTERKGV